MALTSGFFNSIDGDRKYNALQFGSIFDGIIEDGVFRTIGNRFHTSHPQSGFRVAVDPGRAWFKHTWVLATGTTYVDIPQPDPTLPRWDALIIDINRGNNYRKTEFKVISGTPAANPSRPSSFVQTDDHYQVPIAFILIQGGASDILDSSIFDVVGNTSYGGPPWVTGPLETVDVSSVYSDIRSQWNEFYASALTQMEQITTLYNSVNSQYQAFVNRLNQLTTSAEQQINQLITTSTNRINQLVHDCEGTFTTFMVSCQRRYEQFLQISDNTFKQFMRQHNEGFNDFVVEKNNEFEGRMNDWNTSFSSFWTEFKSGMVEYLATQEDIWETWFNHIQGQLSDDAATNLQRQIDALSFVYILGTRAVLGITASAIHERVVFGTYGSVADDRVMITAPSRDTVWVFDDKAILSVIATVIHNRAIFGTYGATNDERVVITAPSWQPVH